ncbi:MAG: tetratricopeptide repeat protein [Planctomycetia bacterium]|nr:tetratricopeptide repeat protein [Planctomycetia bacterium]
MKGFDVNIVQKEWVALRFILVLFIAGLGASLQAEDRIAADAQFNGNLALTTGGEYEIAEKGWEDFLKKFPENNQIAYAEHYLAICKFQTGQFAEAERIFEKVLADGKFPAQDEAVYYLGVTFLKHAETLPVQATGSRRGRVETVGDRNYAVSQEAVALLQKAMTQFQRIRGQFPDSHFRMDATFYEALTYIHLGNYENALGDLKLVVATRNFTDLNRALYTLAEVYVNLSEPDDKNALITLQTLLENAPSTYWKLRATRLMGDIYFRLGSYELATEAFASLLDGEEFAEYNNPEKEVPAVLNLAYLYYRNGETMKKLRRYGEAVEMFSRIGKKFPESSVALHALYQQALAMKSFNDRLPEGATEYDLAECATLWNRILEDERAKKDRVLRRSATHQLALYHLRMDEPEKALKVIDRISKKQHTPTLLRDRADALAGCERNDEAVAIYRQLFQKNQSPKTMIEGADAMLRAVWLTMKQENYTGVLQLTGEVILWDAFSRLPEGIQTAFLEENASALFQLNDYKAAREGWERLLEKYPDAVNRDRWSVSVAYCFQKSGASKDGCNYILKAQKKVKDAVTSVEMRHLLGVCYRDYAQTKKSEKLVTKYLDRARNHLVKAKNAARKLEKSSKGTEKDAENAEKSKNVKNTEKYAGLDMIYYDLSMVYFLQKNYKSCVKNIGFGLKNCPDSPIVEQLEFLKGRCEIEMEKLEEAAGTFEAFLEKFPKSPQAPEAGLLASQCFLKLGKMEEAVRVSREMAARFPESNMQERGANVQAIAAMEVEDYDAALEAWNVILESDTEESHALRPEALYQIAYCHFQKKEYKIAEDGFHALLAEYQEWDSLERVYNQLIRAYLEQEKLQEAQDLLAEMRGKYPESVFLRSLDFQLGMLWFVAGKMEEAQATFQLVLNASEKKNRTEAGKEARTELPDFLQRNAEVKSAWARFHRGEYQDAVDFIQTLDVKPELPEIAEDNVMTDEERNEFLANRAELRFLEGMAYYHLKNRSQALKLLKDVRKDGTLPRVFSENVLEIIVQIYEETEKWQSVVNTGADFLELYPDSKNRNRMEFKRAVALFHLEKLEEALAQCETLLSVNDEIFTPQAMFLKGEILFAQKQYELAIQAFYQVIYGVKEPKLQGDALFETAQCFEMLEKPDKALKHYQELLQDYPKSDKAKLAKRKMKKLQ